MGNHGVGTELPRHPACPRRSPAITGSGIVENPRRRGSDEEPGPQNHGRLSGVLYRRHTRRESGGRKIISSKQIQSMNAKEITMKRSTIAKTFSVGAAAAIA